MKRGCSFPSIQFPFGWTVRFLSVGQRLWPNPEPDGPTVTSSFKHGRGEANTSDLIATVVGFYQRSYGVSHPKREKLLTCCSITVLRTAVVMLPGRFPVGAPYQKRSGRRERTLSSVATREAVALTGFRPGNRGRCLLSSPCRLSSEILATISTIQLEIAESLWISILLQAFRVSFVAAIIKYIWR